MSERERERVRQSRDGDRKGEEEEEGQLGEAESSDDSGHMQVVGGASRALLPWAPRINIDREEEKNRTKQRQQWREVGDRGRGRMS